ncbi:hypothetical protein QGM61_06510 [Pseudohongiella sp. SYSU M77423]|nr:hypothetical protein [Pseudohongiella sp. SYSU M77423]
MIMYYLADLQFTKLNIFGNEVVIGNPLYIPMMLWLILSYWFVRYMQYFIDLDDRSYRDKFNKTYDRCIFKYHLKKLNSDPVKLQELGTVDGKQRLIKPFNINSYNRQATWAKFEYSYYVTHLRSGDVEALKNHSSHTVEISGLPVLLIYLWARFSGFALTTYATEYLLPILLFLATLIIAWL